MSDQNNFITRLKAATALFMAVAITMAMFDINKRAALFVLLVSLIVYISILAYTVRNQSR